MWVTYWTSLTVSRTWNSHPNFFVLQSNVAMWPLCPPIRMYLSMRVMIEINPQMWCMEIVTFYMYLVPAVSRVADGVWAKSVQVQVEILNQRGYIIIHCTNFSYYFMLCSPCPHLLAVDHWHGSCNILLLKSECLLCAFSFQVPTHQSTIQ